MNKEYLLKYLIRGAEEVAEVTEGVNNLNVGTGVARGVSLTKIKVIDLVSEGEIEGLVKGEYSYVGRKGEIGWDAANYSRFKATDVDGNAVPWLRSIFWNGVPIIDSDNKFNFEQVEVAYSNGPENGADIDSSLRDELTITRVINERLRGPLDANLNLSTLLTSDETVGYSKTYRIYNSQCKSARLNMRFNSLSKTDSESGDVSDSTVVYRIYYRPVFYSGGSTLANKYVLAKEETVTGKISYGFIKKTRINFQGDYSGEPSFAGWDIKIIRITPESHTVFVRNQTTVDSLTEIYRENFGYPNSAVVSQEFSAEYFSSIPARTFDLRGLKVKVPDNYDPILKKYYGAWGGAWKTDVSGNLKKEWTDNPAWCFYDLLTNTRYGLGKYIDESLVDKWTLFEISKYCDQLVDDGYGSLEPRFTCNLLINSQDEAYDVINSMASIFRAIVYYNEGGICVSQDSEKQPVFAFTNANVEDGNFNYSSTSKRNRHSIAVVRYNDKKNLYKPAIEYVEDLDAIKKYGIREVELIALGCTSKGQAIRYGKWGLISESLETDAINFVAGLEGALMKPGDLFTVFDANKKGVRHGGRVKSIVQSGLHYEVELDGIVSGLSSGIYYSFYLTTPTYRYNASYLTGATSNEYFDKKPMMQSLPFYGEDVTSNGTTSSILFDYIDFGRTFDFVNYSKIDDAVWMIEATGDSVLGKRIDDIETYRVVNVVEREPHRYEIAGIQYAGNKFQKLESGNAYQGTPDVVTLPSTPGSISFSQEYQSENETVWKIDYSITPVGDDTYSLLVYAKDKDPWVYTDFSEDHPELNESSPIPSYPPNSEYLIDVLPATAGTSTYVATPNISVLGDKTRFRIYSKNVYNVICEVPLTAQYTWQHISLINNVSISNLRLSGMGVDDIFNTRISGSNYNTSPSFNWQAGYKTSQGTLSPFTEDLSFRVSIRKSSYEKSLHKAEGTELYQPDDTYVPSNVIYYQASGLKQDGKLDFGWQFPINDNINAWLANNGGTGKNAFRDYDIVVEAHDPNLYTSASLEPGVVANYQEPQYFGTENNLNAIGYDIMYVNNPWPVSPRLVSDKTAYFGASDKLVRVDLNKADYSNGADLSNVVGGYFFICPDTFTKAEAVAGKTAGNKQIHVERFNCSPRPSFLVNVTGTNLTQEGYLRIAFFDNLAQELDERLQNYTPKQLDVNSISNSVIIKPQVVSTDDDYRMPRAWLFTRVKIVALGQANQNITCAYNGKNTVLKEFTYNPYVGGAQGPVGTYLFYKIEFPEGVFFDNTYKCSPVQFENIITSTGPRAIPFSFNTAAGAKTTTECQIKAYITGTINSNEHLFSVNFLFFEDGTNTSSQIIPKTGLNNSILF